MIKIKVISKYKQNFNKNMMYPIFNKNQRTIANFLCNLPTNELQASLNDIARWSGIKRPKPPLQSLNKYKAIELTMIDFNGKSNAVCIKINENFKQEWLQKIKNVQEIDKFMAS